MLRKLAAAVVLVPLSVLIVLFAVANRQRVVVSFDPFSSGDPILATPPIPLCFVILLPLIAGVIVGGIATFVGQGRWRKTARWREAEVRRLHAEAHALKLRLESRPREAPGRSTSSATQVALRRPPAA